MPEPIITHHISDHHAIQGPKSEVEKIAAPTQPAPDTIAQVQEAARYLLAAYDAFMGACELTPVQMEADRMVRNGALYGAAAFMAAPDQDHGAHAMARAFLLAVIDPAHPDLDYLRADPAAGQVARDATAALAMLTKGGE